MKSRHRQPTGIRSVGIRSVGIASALAACLILGACAFGPPPPDESGQPPKLPTPSASVSTPDDGGGSVDLSVLATKIPAPWGVAFLPDGTGLVTERRTGHILSVGQPVTSAGLTVTTVGTVPGISAVGDGGLLGIAVSPHYATDATVYVYYSTTRDNRIASLKLGGVPHPIVTGIPHAATDNGGALAFGPDGYLYASTGDAGHAANSQNAKSLAGKILRISTTGRAAPHNPTSSSRVYALGLHNVEGLAWDPAKHLYVVDANRTGLDALDLVLPGANYGWGVATGKSGTKPTITTPMLTWPVATSGCSGVAAVDAILVTACLTGAKLWLVSTTAAGGSFGAPVALLDHSYGRLRAIVMAPDGSFWITTSNTDGHGKPGPDDDQIIRLVIANSGAGKS